jgi:hypothetical protein
VDEGVLSPRFPVVHNQLLCLADVEGEVVFQKLKHNSCGLNAVTTQNKTINTSPMMVFHKIFQLLCILR